METTDREAEIDRLLARDGVPVLLGKARAARLLDCTTRTIEVYVARGRLKSLKADGRNSPALFLRRDIARMLAREE